MNLSQAQSLLGKNIAINANGGSLFVGKLTGISESPTIHVVDDGGVCHSFNIDAVDGWVVEGVPSRLGGGEVTGS